VTLILPGIRSLVDHLRTMRLTPEAYRPDQCPYCAHGAVWSHGCYTRKADENSGADSLNPVPIPRYWCSACRKTCSVLPEVIPPRRWYLWAVQHAVLAVLLAGGSCYRASTDRTGRPAPQTIRRWWDRLTDRFAVQAATLCPRFPELGRTPELRDFWSAALALRPLSAVMSILQADGVAVP
jgi:hypothetical protein